MRESARSAEQDPLIELLAASATGDRQAFAQAYQISASRLYPVALRIMRRREAAEDVLQEAYVQIWRKAAQYEPARGKPISWMATIVRHRAIDRLRSESSQPRDPAQWDEAAEALADPVTRAAEVPAHDAIAIRTCLEGLQEKPRISILLAYYYGMTHEELSKRLEAPLGTVKSWVRRGLVQLKECLET